MIQHHPADDLLLALAAGNLPSGPSVVVASHLESCAHCRERVQTLETLGGALLEELTPALLSSQALASALAAIDAPPPAPARAAAGGAHPALPHGMRWPRALQGCIASPWRWIGPGMRWSRVALPHDSAANVFLLRIGAGKSLPMHTHSQSELTQVLHGSFNDGRALFGPGDFDEADDSILHQPVVRAGSECICLASVEGKVLFQGLLARTLGAMIGM